MNMKVYWEVLTFQVFIIKMIIEKNNVTSEFLILKPHKGLSQNLIEISVIFYLPFSFHLTL